MTLAPQNLDEYNARYNARIRYTGFGPDTRVFVPCPFCCAPDFMTWKVWPGDPENVEAVMAKGATCASCKRGCRALFTRLGSGGVTFEVVQTEGDAPPDWLPAMRRVTDFEDDVDTAVETPSGKAKQ